ncbi:SNF2 helicase associated domain-containing protein [Viridibacillus sp. YIM B01967]|uniref:SNF2 helicase associated domain-containing protein n=1 Tax=Viridibacillus soli TaxID=2798301 RepID=A0ABS1H308_9BACL|nr:DEAD/DEAH box helicase [Viridibacillus soli]MBK3493810.1 SNF2 helicase associated domain-containing protein [Viridibacillus soli]
MNFSVNETKVKKLCGVIAFKKGKAYYQAGKVNVQPFLQGDSIIKASVKAGADFDVTVKADPDGEIVAECSCPPIGSVQTYCQHIAAVMLAIEEVQQVENPLATKMLGLFGNRSMQTSRKQVHFDSRQTLNVEITCLPILLSASEYVFGMQLKMGSKALYDIPNITKFLDEIERREPFEYAPGFIYAPERHSFLRETDEVLQFLMKSQRVKSKIDPQEERLLISATDWEQLLPLLTATPEVKFMQEGKIYDRVQVGEELPLSFEFDESNLDSYRLDVKGLNKITILRVYGYAFSEGKLYKLPQEDCNRLAELKEMLDQSGEHQLVISENQIDHFMENVIPGLMKLGHVNIAESVSKRMGETPLRAKLFLDRVKHRILAGLEFHYDHLVINPCEETEQSFPHYPGIRRQRNKEQQIIKLLLENSFTQTPGGFYLYDEEAEYQFLYHNITKLEKWVQIYATTAVKMRIHKGYTGPRIKVEVGERTEWLAFRFDLKGISESEIQKVLTSLEEKRKYYRVPNGTLVSLETPEFLMLHEFLNDLGISTGDINGEEIRVPLIRGMQLIDSLEQGDLMDPGENFAKLMKNLKDPEKQDAAVPDTLNSVLRDYQKIGFSWFKLLAKYKFGGILADDMGLGKTLQSIAFIESVLPDVRAQKRSILIIAPSSLVYNWKNELEKFTPHMNVQIVDGNKVTRTALWKSSSGADVIITSYPSLRMDIAFYRKRAFHTLFLDEAQAFKNPTTKTAKSVKKIQADYRFALTGTPIENSIDELWSIFHVVFPELLPDRRTFSELRREDVAKRVRPFILRRLKSEVLKELPNKIETIHYSELQLEQKTLYAAYLAELKHDALKHLRNGSFQQNRIKILAALTRLRQVCCHPALYIDDYAGSSAKFEQLMGIIEECRISGRRVLVFSQFTQMLSIIGRQLVREGVPYFYLDGQTPPADRVELCDRFNNGEGNLFLISLKAGGTGLNLTGADTVVLYDLWWNPAVEQQAADRAHRMGQKNEVHVIRLVAKGTIEEKINELQQKKKHLIDEVIHSGQDSLTTMTEQDIRDILMIE